jgi:hypothetical protein
MVESEARYAISCFSSPDIPAVKNRLNSDVPYSDLLGFGGCSCTQHAICAMTDLNMCSVMRQPVRATAWVSPNLLDVYGEDGMTLEQLMAFSVTDNHARQEQVWEQVNQGQHVPAYHIRRLLTEDAIDARDRRVQFIGLDAYSDAGGYLTTVHKPIISLSALLWSPAGSTALRATSALVPRAIMIPELHAFVDALGST